jgi:uncharacterized repeat protein (TIGR01451 family)
VTASAGTSVVNTASIGSSSTSTDPNLGNNTATSTITVGTPVCAGGCGPSGNATGTLNVVVTGLKGGATSTLIVGQSSWTPVVVASVINGVVPFVIKIGNPYEVSATTTASGYSATLGAGCSGTFATSTTCDVTFSGSSVAPSVDLSVTKTVSNATPITGTNVDYTITASASGNATSTGVTATDVLPVGLAFVSATSSKGTYASSTGIWNVGDMAPTSTATLDITATVTASAGTSVVNTASIGSSSTSTDPNLGNNTATSTITVGSQYGNLVVTKTVDNNDPKGGDTVTYTVTVTNLKSASSSFVVVHDALPFGLSINSATTTPGTGVYNSGTGDWDVGTLGPNGTAKLMVSVTVGSQLDGQTATNTASVYTTLDPATTLSSSSVAIAVQPAVVPPINPPCTSNCGGGGGGGGQAYEIAIDGGVPTTATTSATLSLYGTGAYTMEISNSSNFSSSTWQSYATSLPWVLTSGGGEKTVYAKYRDVQGNILATVHASIDLIQGQVLGASTSSVSTSCGIYLNDYIKLGKSNDSFEVRKLQVFLNYNLGTNLPITGVYDLATYHAVERFQMKYNSSVLSPWVPYGLTSNSTPTGYVYKTTRRWINVLMCSTLNIPMPQLP